MVRACFGFTAVCFASTRRTEFSLTRRRAQSCMSDGRRKLGKGLGDSLGRETCRGGGRSKFNRKRCVCVCVCVCVDSI